MNSPKSMELGSPGSEIFQREVVDEEMVKKLCFGGVKSKYRAIAWGILFQVVGLRRRFHPREMESQHRRYIELLTEMNDLNLNDGRIISMNVDHLRCDGIRRFRFELSKKTIHQIDIDVRRIDLRYRNHSGVDTSHIYYRILSLIAHRRPGLGYIQGMADILVPFIQVFSDEDIRRTESNSYSCYSRLLDEIQHNMIELQTGMIRRLDNVLDVLDPDFNRFLKEIGLETHMFAFRWFNCFFTREFKIHTLYKILDTIFASDNINELLLYFGLALLMNFKPILIGNDFSHNILFLQSIHEKEWEDVEIELLLSSARFYRNMISRHLSKS